jgi:hypothetical protein
MPTTPERDARLNDRAAPVAAPRTDAVLAAEEYAAEVGLRPDPTAVRAPVRSVSPARAAARRPAAAGAAWTGQLDRGDRRPDLQNASPADIPAVVSARNATAIPPGAIL